MLKCKDLDSPELYNNRELSWLQFNGRVLDQALLKELPLLEKLKFLAIVSSNLDEFFMIRVAGLIQRRNSGATKCDISGLTTAQQLSRISEQTRGMIAKQGDAVKSVLAKLREHNLSVLRIDELTSRQLSFLEYFFNTDILPLLTPLLLKDKDSSPLVRGMKINIGLVIESRQSEDVSSEKSDNDRLVVVGIPSCLPAFITLPADTGVCLIPVEDVVSNYIRLLFTSEKIIAKTIFRITRDADVDIQEDEAGDLLDTIARAVVSRARRGVVRLEIQNTVDTRLKHRLMDWFELKMQDVYQIDGLINASRLMEIFNRSGFDNLKLPDWPPQTPRGLVDKDDLWQAIEEKDILLSHPYESFDPVVELLEAAAEDPDVLVIKQTLYRTSGDSPVISALEKAAQNGKQVTVLVELKARFDEANNITWAMRLENAGCYVIYGIAGFKTHGKALLIVRRSRSQLRRYVHLSTGNYNDKTARLYSDIGLFTADAEMTADTAAFFNLLTGYSDIVPLSQLVIAPTSMRQKIIDLIDREISCSTPDRRGLIMAKINSLEDPGICKALYRASQAGVKVMLNVRGICCLKPGIKGVSKNIEVCSIVDRYLEHARIFYFANGGREEVYLSSADWMRRNLDARLEILFPIKSPELCARLVAMLKVYFADNVSSYALQPDGSYKRKKKLAKKVRAQEVLHQEIKSYIQSAKNSQTKFHPMVKPKKESQR